LRGIIHINKHAPHQQKYGQAIKFGLDKHSVDCVVTYENGSPDIYDFAVCWGWRRAEAINHAKHILIMEGAHVYHKDRLDFASLGWNGLANRGKYPKSKGNGKRWEKHFSGMLIPWKSDGDHALIIGQVEQDSALDSLKESFKSWVQGVCDCLIYIHEVEVVYRPHPKEPNNFCPRGASLSNVKTVEEDLNLSRLCVTFNSTCGVQSVLFGIPTVAFDKGSMAWDVTAHELNGYTTFMPNREKWAHDLAFTQWDIDEIKSGEAWEHLKGIMHCVN